MAKEKEQKKPEDFQYGVWRHGKLWYWRCRIPEMGNQLGTAPNRDTAWDRVREALQEMQQDAAVK